ncbi:MAG: adenylyltransferase/cytidyltransferase family protein [Sulfuricaulis sp.]|nr:adenylyltransferase/cytidyltransferase family protein [Sulfuricaulis sp.]
MTVVLANGVFDLLHPGHVYHLRAAKKMGDELVVALTRDEAVNKGPGRPVFGWEERAAVLRELRCVDRVILVSSSLEALWAVRPDIFVKGADYRESIRQEDAAYCRAHDIEIRFTDEPGYSSTALLRYGLGRR